MTREPLIVLSGVNKHFGRLHVLQDIELAVGRGEVVVIIGPSGSGKSTLCRTINGLEPVESGTITIDGEPLPAEGRALARLRADVGMVFQSFNLIPTLTAHENIVLPLSIAGRNPDQQWYDHVIDTVGLRDRLGHRPSELSGGQQQRVACARALDSRPDIVFADEPTGNLDSTSGAEVLGFLRRSVDEFDQTVVMVTHDPVAAAHADRLITLRDGKIVQDGAPGSADDVIELMKQLG